VQRAEGKSNTAKMLWVVLGHFMNTSKDCLEKGEVSFNEKDLISVNVSMETNVPGIYAVGEIASNWCLPHGATQQGCVAGRHAAGKEVYKFYEAIFHGVFACPEIASAGVFLQGALERASSSGRSFSLACFRQVSGYVSKGTIYTNNKR
jgi:dihydrolipoamide dehydrogenase